MNNSTKKLTAMAMFIAISIALVALVHFPIIPTAAFLEYDPADVPILIGTFTFGPGAGLLITIIASVIQGITVSSASGLYGILMHIVATGSFVLVAGLIYQRKKTKTNAVIALFFGTLAMTAMMTIANLVVTPYFLGVPVDVVAGMLLPAIIPFNLIKAGINSVITFFIYKAVSKYIHNKIA